MVMSAESCQQQLATVDGIRQLFQAHQRLILKINPKQNPGFLIRHLTKIFEAEKQENEIESQAMEKIRTVFEVYQTVSMYDSEDATAVLLENLAEIFSTDITHEMSTPSHISTTPAESEHSMSINDFEGKIESDFEFETAQDHETNGTGEFGNGQQQGNSDENQIEERDCKTRILFPEPQTPNPSSSSAFSPTSPPNSSVNSCSNFSQSNGHHNMKTREKNLTQKVPSPLLPPPLVATKLSPIYSCHYCGKKFSTNGACQVHIRNHERFYPCGICSLTFNDTFSLRRHEKFHNSGRISQSSSSSSSSAGVTTGALSLSSSSSSSAVSTKQNRFQNRQQRELLLNQSTNQPGNSRVVQKPQRVSLQVGSNTNSTSTTAPPKKRGRPWGKSGVQSRFGLANRTCKHCRKVCQSHGALVVHTRTHTGEKPFECDLCDRKFSDPGNFNKHRVRQHGK